MPEESIGRKSIGRLANDLANGWKEWLGSNQRQVLASEVEQLIEAVLKREYGKERPMNSPEVKAS